MAGGSDNKTEKPTARRLLKTREKGQVARSKEVPSAAVLTGMLLILGFTGQQLFDGLQLLMKRYLVLKTPTDFSISFISGEFLAVGHQMGLLIVPLLLAAVALAVGANMVQIGGILISWEAVGFKFERLNPSNGLKRIFSKNGLVELLKSLALLGCVTLITYKVVLKYTTLYPRLVLMDLRQLLYWTASISYELFLRVALFLVILAIADFAFQKYSFLEQLKMTKQEIRDELKDTEGDPKIKGRIRRIQLEMTRKRMMASVPKADVVITNPTHYAVALSYKVDRMEAPQVVAKGVGYLALKIKELAQQHDVPLVENKPLAQTLYKTVEIGEYIPAALYKAVAEILAYIYKARNAWSR